MKTALCAFITLVIGITAGFFAAGGFRTAEEAVSESGKRAVKSETASAGSDAGVKVLRARILELERRLKEARTAPVEEKSGPETVAAPPATRFDFRRHFERMKTEDPQRYQQITNSFAAFRRHRADRAATRMEFLSSIDTSGMSAAAIRTHEELKAVIAEHEELEARMHDENLADEERMELFGRIRESNARMRRLNAQERNNLLQAAARNLGLNAPEAKEFASVVKEVIDATSSSHGFPRFHGNRGR